MISVVIPTYKRNDLLERCLIPLTPGVQTLDPSLYEVIVTDDAPEPGNARAMVESAFPWVKWTQGPGRGPASNRNHGARQATGDWLAFTDDDCIPDVNWLQAFFEATASGHRVYEGKTTCKDGIPSMMYTSPINVTGGYLWSCNMMVAATTYWDLKGFEESFPYPASEDMDFRERLKDAGYDFPFVNKAVVDHPARQICPPKRQLQLQESIYYFHARRNSPFRARVFIDHKLRGMVKGWLKKPLHLQTYHALAWGVTDIILTLRHLPRWTTKYPLQHPQTSLSATGSHPIA